MRGCRVALLAVSLVGCGLLPGQDHGLIRQLDLEPRPGADPGVPGDGPIGPIVEVARGVVDGEGFTVTVHADPSGACIYLDWEMHEGGVCGSMPDHGRGETDDVGVVGTGGAEGRAVPVLGLVTTEADAVLIETDLDPVTAVLVPLEPAQLDATLFLAFVPVGTQARAVVAVGGDAVLERFDLGFFPDFDGGAMPTPATP